MATACLRRTGRQSGQPNSRMRPTRQCARKGRGRSGPCLDPAPCRLPCGSRRPRLPPGRGAGFQGALNRSAVGGDTRVAPVRRAFSQAYEEFLVHSGLEASRNYPGNAHENGDVEAARRHFNPAVDQRLRLSGTRDFGSVERYARSLREISGSRKSRCGERPRTPTLSDQGA